jgi:hypothetical protein
MYNLTDSWFYFPTVTSTSCLGTPGFSGRTAMGEHYASRSRLHEDGKTMANVQLDWQPHPLLDAQGLIPCLGVPGFNGRTATCE